MRIPWERLNEALSEDIVSATARAQFRLWRACEPAVAAFDTPHALVAYLTGLDRLAEDLDTKDRIYATLVRAVQAQWVGAQLAYALVWCGLLPGLAHVYHRHTRRSSTDPDEVASQIADAFTRLVGRMDLACVRRVAATLVRSVHRELLIARRRAREEHARRVEVPYGRGVDLERFAGAHGVFAESRVHASDPALDLARLRERILPVIGVDADLLLSVSVRGENLREAAKRLGLSHDVARKRHQRALARLRAYFEEGGMQAE